MGERGGSVWETGKGRAGSRIPKVRGGGGQGGRRKGKHNILQSKKCKEVGANKNRAGTGIKWYGKQGRFTPSCPPSPPPQQRWREEGKDENYATFHNILQPKKNKEAGADKCRAGQELGLKGTERTLLSALKVFTSIWCSKVSNPRH